MKKLLVCVFIVLTLSSCMYLRPVTKEDYRKITAANMLAIGIPGLTQVLNGEYVKGALFFAGTMIPSIISAGVFGTEEGSAKPGMEIPFGITAGIGGVSYMWSFFDGVGTTLRYSKQSRQIAIENSNFSEQEKYAISKRSVFIGMSADAVIISLGKPSKINRSVGSWGVHEQWVYSGSYVYIENGYVSSWQD